MPQKPTSPRQARGNCEAKDIREVKKMSRKPTEEEPIECHKMRMNLLRQLVRRIGHVLVTYNVPP
eukprot:scaffold31682_cov212-Skeletonema_marinoi.AAC.1